MLVVVAALVVPAAVAPATQDEADQVVHPVVQTTPVAQVDLADLAKLATPTTQLASGGSLPQCGAQERFRSGAGCGSWKDGPESLACSMNNEALPLVSP